jgi:hypothetical protein
MALRFNLEILTDARWSVVQLATPYKVSIFALLSCVYKMKK